MPDRRAEIRMTTEEIEAFLREPHHLQVATLNADGTIHLVAMWYGFLDGQVAFETYRKSQKVVNLWRDPRLTVLAEAGRTYAELRGVQMTGWAEIVEDNEDVVALARSVVERYEGLGDRRDVEAAARLLARKRVAVKVIPQKVVSWDHRKLG